MADVIRSRIGQVLLGKGVADEETIKKALEIQRECDADHRRRRLGDILVEDLGLDHDQVFGAIAETYAFKKLDLSQEAIDEARIEFIKTMLTELPDEVADAAIAKHMIPFKSSDDQSGLVYLITPDPTDGELAMLAARMKLKRYEFLYAPLAEIDQLIDKVAPARNDFLEMVEEASQSVEVVEEEESGIDEEALDAEIHQSMLTNLIEGCLVEGVRQGASDIHVVPREGNKTDFFFRLDGNLELWHTQEKTKPEAVSAVIKDRSRNVDRFERDMAQDGFIQRKIDGTWIRYRVSMLPIVGAEFDRKWESTVIRILDDRKVITDLGRLGLQKQSLDAFQKAISSPQGMVILTGPTGSGKSTTLVAALHQVMKPELNVLTVEEPVEYLIPGARQIKISHKLDFDMAVRAILRHDPNIVMVGEMRDLKTAEIGIKLANTGHLTFSTLHTNDAPSAVSRLFKMGVETFLIAYAINIVVAQRLIRTLCKECKRPVQEMDEGFAKRLGFSDEDLKNNTIYEAVGCDKCSGGYKGRTAIHECLLFTKEIRRLIVDAQENINEEAIKNKAVEQGMLTLRRSGLERIKEGVTSMEEIAFVTAED